MLIEGSLEVKLPTICTDEKQRWEESEKRREERRSKTEEKRRRKKIENRKSPKKEGPGARKGRKVATHGVFPMICGSGGSKSRLAKAAGAEPAGQMRDEKLHAVVARSTFQSQKCQKLTGSEHFWKLRCRQKVHAVVARSTLQVKKLKAPQPRSTFRSCDVEKVHAVVARSAFPSQNVQNTMLGPLLEVEMSKKCTPLWREAHFKVTTEKNWGVLSTFGRSDVVSRGRRKELCTLSKVSKTWRFCASFKTDGRRGTYAEDMARCISRGRRSTRDMFTRAVRRSGRWFPETGRILEHQIFSFGKMILRDRCSTSCDIASLFRGRHSTLDRLSGKATKRIGTRPWALHSTFLFWRKSRRIVLFLTLSTSKVAEVSQNCLVFDVVKFKEWGRLAEVFRFWRCQVQTLRTSRRLVSFLMLSSSKIEEVSQNCWVFKLPVRQTDRQTGRQAGTQAGRQADRQTDRETEKQIDR